MSLVDRLKERQGDKTQMQFATELGITQSALSRIYSKDRRIGPRVAGRIRARFPELSFEIAAFLLGDDMTTEQATMTA